MEADVTADIARRVLATGRYTETAEIMARNMSENGFSPAKINTEVMRLLNADKKYQMAVAENTSAYKREVTAIISETVNAAQVAGDEIVANAGMMSYNNDLSLWESAGQDLSQPNNLHQLTDAMRRQTNNEIRNLTRTTAFRNTANGYTAILNMYTNEMDLATLKLATGTFSYDQVVNDCVHRLAQSGLRTVDYASGRSYQLDTAVRMQLRTACSQLAGKITEANIESTGVDLVITSQHIGSRPDHAVWQNKVFAYKGHSEKYPDFVSSTGYGTVGGLKGANCTHDFYPYWDGISIIEPDLKEPAPVMVNGREYDYYQATQKQRSMERSIRALRREIEAQRAIGGDISVLQANLRKQSADYHNFSVAVGIRAKNNRIRVI
jgi:hypothetical protein